MDVLTRLKAVWPSGKAVDCKSSIPSSNLGAASTKNLLLSVSYYIIVIVRGRGGIGRHDGLKIRCLVIVREGSSPSVPNRFQAKYTVFENL